MKTYLVTPTPLISAYETLYLNFRPHFLLHSWLTLHTRHIELSLYCDDEIRIKAESVIGKSIRSSENNHQGIVTIVDRCSKFTLMKKVASKHAEPVKQAILDLLKPIQEHTLTITSYNGKEFSYQQKISRVLNTAFYFAHLYQSWHRGLNEYMP